MGRQRGGRLVEDEHAGLAVKRLGDFHHLPAPKGEISHRRVERLGQADEGAGLRRPLLQDAVVDEAEAQRIGAEPDVLGDRKLCGQAQLLLDNRDPGGARGAGGQLRGRAPVEEDLASVRLQGARQKVDQGGFPGAVLAEQGVNPARLEGNPDAVQHQVSKEPLRHLPGFQQNRVHPP